MGRKPFRVSVVGLKEAYDTLSREVNNAVTTIIMVPLEEYQRTGAQVRDQNGSLWRQKVAEGNGGETFYIFSEFLCLRYNLFVATAPIVRVLRHLQGAAKKVVRAVPVAVLRPIIGASEAVSLTLQVRAQSIAAS
jgi:hypothetical protein